LNKKNGDEEDSGDGLEEGGAKRIRKKKTKIRIPGGGDS
jgi:hypothetical protein